ncbi:hypothetical protein M9980_07705 [Sphingomonas donggukensis]|uniref:DUF7336 domain-containing protein n=1 Tax=Sphingomonas donggukensis TaxID=2949093 RepID=A0ABY4TST5_9SPHN|nr:hypothetical protein [Sphingomonas donggukensis]URW74472.1 hypothetical protein M9980_07705 [Sphingomonas donggukensis]
MYLLHHVREDDEYREDAKLIGVYRSRATAEQAITRLAIQPGFCDYPQGFEIGEMPLDRDHWEEGFVRMIGVLMPLHNAGADVWRPVEAEVLPLERFKIIGPMPNDEVWRYAPGSIVRCEVQRREHGETLVAVARA